MITAVLTVSMLIYTVFPKKYTSYIEKYSNEFDVEAELCYSVARCESGFLPEKTSNKGAVGVMQIMPNTAKWCCDMLGEEYDYERLKTAEYNIKIGVFYLSYLKTKFSSLDDVIKAYNAGETVVREWNRKGKEPYEETKNYLKKVKLCMKIYRII